MAVPEKCDVCGDRHHKHQAHRFPKPVVVNAELEDYGRGIFTSFVSSVDPGPVLAVHATNVCKVCGKEFEAKRRHAVTCSPKCRQARSRERRGK